MTNQKRVPGAVDDKADPIGKPLFPRGSRSPANESQRDPGPVNEPTEPISDYGAEQTAGDEVPWIFIESSPWKIVFALVVSAGTIWLLAEAAIALIAVYNFSIYLGIPAIILALLVLLSIGWAGHREYRALKNVDRLEERNAGISTALERNDQDAFRQTLDPILENIRKREPDIIREYKAAIENSGSVSDSLKQFENIVLGQLDEEVNLLIKHTVMVGSAAVAIIPHPALDALFVLWRGQNLVRKIGIIYGLEPTGLSSWRLLKYVITSAFIAASIEEFGEIALEQVTQKAFASAIKPLAESSATALRLFRLGQMAKHACRPKAV
jgi:uncharacterized membrane protein YcjF (UPF0283 family)